MLEFVNIIAWNNCIMQFLMAMDGSLRNGNQLEFVLNIECKDILFVAFQQKNSTGQKSSHV
jgi:hypothetical protein